MGELPLEVGVGRSVRDPLVVVDASVEVEGILNLQNVGFKLGFSWLVRSSSPLTCLPFATLSRFNFCSDSEAFASFFLLLISGIFVDLSLSSALGFLCLTLREPFSSLYFLLNSCVSFAMSSTFSLFPLPFTVV